MTETAAWRTRMGLSQRAAAKALGVSLPTFQAWERGRYLGSHSTLPGKACQAPKTALLAMKWLESSQPLDRDDSAP